MSIRRFFLLTAIAGASLPTAPLFAQAGSFDPTIEVVLATRGMSKGLAQTDGPQLLVRPELALGDFFVAAYAKNVVSSGDDGIEAGILAGGRVRLAGFQLTGSVAYKRLEGIGGGVDDEALELVFGIGRRFGAVTARGSATWSPDELGATRSSLFLETGFALDLGHGTAVSANVGRRERRGGPDYTAFNIGVTQSLWRGISAELRYYDTAESALGDAFHARVVGSLRARF